MSKRATRVATQNPGARSQAVEEALRRTFTTEVVDELREQTGYNPRQRSITAQRLMLVVVEAFLMGQTLGFSAIRAIFVRRFGFVRHARFRSASNKRRPRRSFGRPLSVWSPPWSAARVSR